MSKQTFTDARIVWCIILLTTLSCSNQNDTTDPISINEMASITTNDHRSESGSSSDHDQVTNIPSLTNDQQQPSDSSSTDGVDTHESNDHSQAVEPINWITINLDEFGITPPMRDEEVADNDSDDANPTLAPCVVELIDFAESAPISYESSSPSSTPFPTGLIYNNHPNKDNNDLILPDHVDDMPLFERSTEWNGPRCYQLNETLGGTLYTEDEAFTLYQKLVHETLWRSIDTRPNHRSVIGIRGAQPGTFMWHGNQPNVFNDTIVLLWRDESGIPYVREFPVNTDTGAHNFGVNNSSSLYPNRHYPYINGWHRGYHAIEINLPEYPVRNDSNYNGHWDSDRNGWLSGGSEDYDRLGFAHNIHGSESFAPLSDSLIQNRSAGCQVIPGFANWRQFINLAWTGLGDDVDYYLIDSRDIAPSFFSPCTADDGSHQCPFNIAQFPFYYEGNTAQSMDQRYARYNCDDANEGGAEQVYVLNLPTQGTLRAELTVRPEFESTVDPDIHLLMGDDDRACLERGHQVVERLVPAGRYLLIVDTWVNGDGEPLAGPYEIEVNWAPE